MAKGKVNLKTEEEIDLIRQSCQLACEAIAESIKILKPGTSGKDLDLVAQDYIVSKGDILHLKGMEVHLFLPHYAFLSMLLWYTGYLPA